MLIDIIAQKLSYKVTDHRMQWQLALLLGAVYGLIYFSFMVFPIAEIFYNPDSDYYFHSAILYRMQGGVLDVLDTYSYINFSSVRTAFYPIFLKILSGLGFSFFYITVVQLILFTISFVVLLHRLMRIQIAFSIILIFFIVITFNIYLNHFHFVVLTESLCLSIIFFLITALIVYMKNFHLKTLIICGVLVGILCGIRPAMYPFGLGIMITIICLQWRYFSWRKQAKYLLLGIILPLIAILLLENIIFFSHHDVRRNLALNHFIGKAITINEVTDFHIERVPEKFHPIIIDMHDEKQLNKYVDWKKVRETNLFNYYGLFEAYSYGKAGHLLISLTNNNFSLMHQYQKEIAIAILSTHPLQYAYLTLINYIGLFNVAGILLYPFILLGVFFILASFYCGIRFIMRIFAPASVNLSSHEILAMNLLLWSHGYNLFIALTTVGFSRFLMLSYPMFVLSILLVGAGLLRHFYDK